MTTLVFDIETVGEAWVDIDNATQTLLTRWIRNNSASAIEYEQALEKLKHGLGLSPLTGSIVALGIYDIERSLGAVYYQGDGSGISNSKDDFTFKERSEKELLEDFWEGALSYDTFVSFNGRSFDVPFLLHRSAILGVKPTVSLAGQRYLTRQSMPYHIDMQDECTFYGAMNRKPSLHLLCRAYGIETSKKDCDGNTVAGLFSQKKYLDIAAYNARDLHATAALYQKWKQYLAPVSFTNVVDF